MKITGTLHGSIQAQPSKSMAHRLIICGALSENDCTIDNIFLSDDVSATLSCIHRLGVASYFHKKSKNVLHLQNKPRPSHDKIELDCRESGTTLRLMLPIAAVFADSVTYTGRGRLLERPMQPYAEAFAENGMKYEGCTVEGRLRPGVYSLRGDVSSQFISGLLMSLPLLEGKSEIRLTTPLESAGYVDMTLSALQKAGIEIEKTESGYAIPGGQKYKLRDCECEGDYSHAAFFAVAGALSEQGVTVKGLASASRQKDKAIYDILQNMGANVERSGSNVTVKGGALKDAVVDVSDTPDLVPALAVAMAAAQGESRIIGGERLRIKESDRIATVCENLAKLGCDITETQDGMIINGGRLTGCAVSSFNDHRIAMAMAVAAAICDGEIELDDADCVKKSAPQFWDEFKKLGGKTK